MPDPRAPLVAANWKMHKTVAETEDFLDRFIGSLGELTGIEIVVCPPYTALPAAVERTRRSPVRIAAQNVHSEPAGAFTGEISIPMLVELGVGGSIVGHSERRQLFGETDEALARKLPALLAAASSRSSASARPRPSATPSRPSPCSGASSRPTWRRRRGDPGPSRRRLRADLGDRHRPHGDTRPGPGGVRVHPRAARRRAMPRPRPRFGSSTAAR